MEEKKYTKCDMCMYSRCIISENGLHSVCCLSSKKATDCLIGLKDYFVKNPMIKTDDSFYEDLSMEQREQM